MSEFVDFCNKYTEKYVTSYNLGDEKFTRTPFVIFMKSKKYHKVKTIVESPEFQNEDDAQELFDECGVKMILSTVLSWSDTSDNTSRDEIPDPRRAEMVFIHGKSTNEKEKFYRTYEIDDNRKLHKISEKKDFEMPPDNTAEIFNTIVDMELGNSCPKCDNTSMCIVPKKDAPENKLKTMQDYLDFQARYIQNPILIKRELSRECSKCDVNH